MTELLPSQIVELIIKDLTDRRGFRQQWYETDNVTHEDIRNSWVDIITRAASPSEWQPIESAPMCGAEILVFREDQGVFIAKIATDDDDGDFEDWWSDAYGWLSDEQKPTHWIPLPPPPNNHNREGA